ncbi:MAG TPA: tetratricopeptide repeat protein [Aliicoccus persicus]|uniref:Tetratricopeptide repeat protein n=1 Tax=Aliicoccus persicus TaxID=930138 RepID=A0A921DWY9_9STAP|nr:tetratricopeptide repeat protein [Aliicoccus persicus]
MSKITKAFEYVDLGKYKEAEALYQELLNDELNDKDYESVLNGVGYLYAFTERYDDAIDVYEQLLARASTDEDKAIAYHQIGMVYRMRHDVDNAKRYFGYELDIIKDKDDNDLFVSANFYEFAEVYKIEGELQKAVEMGYGALDHALRTDDHVAIGCAHRVLADCFNEQDQSSVAKFHYEHSLESFKAADDAAAIMDLNDTIDSMS